MMRGSCLGPAFDCDYIRRFLEQASAPSEHIDDDCLLTTVAELINRGAGDPRNPRMQSLMNLKIKYRKSFRPFAPAVLYERVGDYFTLDRPSPYMALVAPVREELHTWMIAGQERLFGIDKLKFPRSTIPAVTHVDYSARVQTVHQDTNPRFYQLLRRFEALTGCAVLVNISFNVRGEPIVCSPEEAYRCFMRTGIDYLVIENLLLDRKMQPTLAADDSWQREIEAD